MFQLKRPGLVLILVCAGLLVLVACGDTASPTSAPAVTGTTVASQPTSASITAPATTPAAMAGMTMTATTPAATAAAASSTMAVTTMAAMTSATATIAPAVTNPATTAAAVSASAQVMEVSIENFSFSPADLKIPVGTKVVWTNKDTTAHTVTSDNKLLNSKLLEQGQKFEFTFNEAGTVEYYCVPHPFMKGKITVIAK